MPPLARKLSIDRRCGRMKSQAGGRGAKSPGNYERFTRRCWRRHLRRLRWETSVWIFVFAWLGTLKSRSISQWILINLATRADNDSRNCWRWSNVWQIETSNNLKLRADLRRAISSGRTWSALVHIYLKLKLDVMVRSFGEVFSISYFSIFLTFWWRIDSPKILFMKPWTSSFATRKITFPKSQMRNSI